MIKLTDQLKWAIVTMPGEEKDKLLLRLISKDNMLVKKLHHQLLEDDNNMLEQREEILGKIKVALDNYKYRLTPGELMMTMRGYNATIGYHVKVTKDKIGEIELTIALVNTAFGKNKTMLHESQKRASTFAEYVAKKAVFVLQKLAKIHEDLQADYEKDVNVMLAYIYDYPPCLEHIKELKIPKTK